MGAQEASALVQIGNWATFIWTVTHEEILQSSLGYYINPLLNVFFGLMFSGRASAAPATLSRCPGGGRSDGLPDRLRRSSLAGADDGRAFRPVRIDS